ncbi:glycoside hydrolase family 13 protein [Catellatospora coxensis]|uniref:Alpha-glucosidase n=1 Tax=Catellatospora coxensis TaxID=310354 RepID=A0A8J3PAZ5_9ACTN|nr:glycoside hydrolase family 13 protein [Catellatospora coxensis]GIG10801.1 alpha-glucosidase [Catellatospora coxensis]
MFHNDARDWWRHAVIYQVYPRSFADANGDGVGDLAGIRAKLGYLHTLGINAIWFSPWYPSPMADAGYDVADYRDIDPSFGTLAEAEALIAEAHELDIRIIVDIVPNHCSDAHAWFQRALAEGPGSPARDLFWFRAGRGEHGELPPNDWHSVFNGPAWTRVADGEWYLHLFAPEQPDLNWENPLVRDEFEDILRFWFDRGVDGIRIDSAAMCVKDPELADFDPAAPPTPHPFVDRDEIHDIYRSWRTVADSYETPRALIGEVWLADIDRFAQYLRADEMHAAFNFDFLGCPWDAKALRHCVDATLASHAGVGAPSTWVLCNHDVTRTVTRYGRAETGFEHGLRQARHLTPTDEALGLRRARAAALLTLALPGSVYVYQGEELGLPDVEQLPDDTRQDPIYHRSGGTDPGRDGCRVPLPWSSAGSSHGFSPSGAAPAWLPQPDWAHLTVEAQQADPGSMLRLYQAALAVRGAEAGLGDGPMTWLDTPEQVVAFTRPGGFTCVVNLSTEAVELPEHSAVLLASVEPAGGRLPADAAAWLRTA